MCCYTAKAKAISFQLVFCLSCQYVSPATTCSRSMEGEGGGRGGSGRWGGGRRRRGGGGGGGGDEGVGAGGGAGRTPFITAARCCMDKTSPEKGLANLYARNAEKKHYMHVNCEPLHSQCRKEVNTTCMSLVNLCILNVEKK